MCVIITAVWSKYLLLLLAFCHHDYLVSIANKTFIYLFFSLFVNQKNKIVFFIPFSAMIQVTRARLITAYIDEQFNAASISALFWCGVKLFTCRKPIQIWQAASSHYHMSILNVQTSIPSNFVVFILITLPSIYLTLWILPDWLTTGFVNSASPKFPEPYHVPMNIIHTPE